MTHPDSFDHLDELLSAPLDPVDRPIPELPLIDCHKCGGSGVWRSFSGMTQRRCFACKGSGKMTQQRQNRVKGAEKAKHTKAINLASYCHEHTELITFMRENSNWNDFFTSMLERLVQSPLTENQELACYKAMAKTIESRETKQAQQRADAPKVEGLSVIQELFETALKNGKKRRALLAAHFSDDGTISHKIKLTPSAAPRKSIWVSVDGEFCGGIEEDGSTRLNRHAPSWLLGGLQRIAADPIGAARLYGKKTGVCCCCARELTDPKSIEAGIGPICEQKWFS